MRLAVLQLMLRPDAESEHRVLAEAIARAVAQGADVVVPPTGIGPDGASELHALDVLGRVALLTGDAAIDEEEYARLGQNPPDALILYPGAESDIQAEAVFEVALELSISLASLVIISERTGAEPGEPGHGGSAVIVLGQVVAEALSDDDILIADVMVPLLAPDPRAPLPKVPPILAQRLAHHRGQRLSVEYPADLS
jgi:predicted amidohydrolase